MSVGVPGLLWRQARSRRAHRHRLLRDEEAQRSLSRAGYHVAPGAVPRAAVDELLRAAEEWRTREPPSSDGRFYFSGRRPPTPATEAARRRIGEVLVPHIERLVDTDRARVGPTVFQMKPSGPASGIRSHQDPFLLDERRGASASVWVALGRVDEAAGPLIMLPGSHRFARIVRVATTTDDLADYHPVIERHARMITMEPGDAVVFDSALIHGSLVNTSGSLRIGASCVVLPTGVPLRVPVPVDGPPPATTDLLTIRGERATGMTSPRPADGTKIGTARVEVIGSRPGALDRLFRAGALLAGSADGEPVPAGRSTG